MPTEKTFLVAVSQKTAQRVVVEPGGKFKAEEGTQYFLQTQNGEAAPPVTVKRAGKDLRVFLEGTDRPEVTIQDFYTDGMDSQLYGAAEDGQIYGYAAAGSDTHGELALADGETASIIMGGPPVSPVPAVSGTVEASGGFLLWPLAVGAAGIGAIAAVNRHDRHSSHKGTATSPVATHIQVVEGADKALPTVTGSGAPGALIHVYDQGVEIGTTTVGKDGTWSFTPTSRLPDGEHSYSVVQAVPGKPPSGPVAVASFIVDTVPPAEPVAVIKGGVDHGGEHYSSSNTPILQGTGEPGDIITITFPTGEQVIATVDTQGHWEAAAPTRALPEGLVDVFISERDPAGNESSVKLSVIVDTIAPTKPSIEQIISDEGYLKGLIGKGNVTDDLTPTLSGKAEAGSTVTVYDNGNKLGEVIADQDGNWSYLPTSTLSQGTHAFTVDATDPAGNTSAMSDAYPVILAVLPVVEPQQNFVSITGVLDNVGEITGAVAMGGKTDDTRPVISGTSSLAAGDTVILYTYDVAHSDHPREIGHALVRADGSWTMQPTQALASGLNSLLAYGVNSAGQQNTLPGTFDITVEPGKPAAPSIVSVSDDVGSYQGFLQKGDVTDDNRPTFLGTAPAGSTVKLYDTGGLLIGSTIADSKGAWTITTGKLADGAHSVTATATNALGVVSDPTAAWNFSVDTVPPSKPSIEQITGDEGLIARGGSTADLTPTLSGKAEAGSTVTLYDNGARLGEVTADNAGHWTYTRMPPLGEGAHVFAVEATDKAGNTSVKSDGYGITLDASPNVERVVAITGVLDNVGEVTGNIAFGHETDDPRPVISGTGPAGDTVTAYTHDAAGSHEIGRTTVQADGTWTMQPALPLLAGLNVLSAVGVGQDGNPTEPSGNYEIMVMGCDLPVPVVIVSVHDDIGPYTGYLQKGDVTDDNQPTFSGTAQPGSTVNLYDGETPIGSGITDDVGNWTITTDKLADGLHHVTATATNSVGVVTDPTGIWPFTVDTTAPSNVSDLVITSHLGAYTGPLAEGDFTEDSRPTLSGSAEPGAKVILYDNGEPLGEALVDAKGQWTFTPSLALMQGWHEFATEVLDAAGNSSGQGESVRVAVDVDGALIVISHVLDSVGSITGDVSFGGSTDDPCPVIQGRGRAGSSVLLKDGDTVLGTTVVDANGNWVFKPSSDLAEGLHRLTASMIFKNGALGSASGAFAFAVDTTPPDKPSIEQISTASGLIAEGGSTTDWNPTLSGKAEAGSIVTIRDNGSPLGTVIADQHGNWAYTASIDGGRHSFTVHATDAAGNTSPSSDAYSISCVDPGFTQLVIDNVTSDNTIDSSEAAGSIKVSGKVVGVYSPGDVVTFTVDGTPFSASVAVDGRWSVDVPGSHLVNDTAHQIDATAVVHDPAGNSGVAAASHAYLVQLSPLSITSMSKDSATDLAHANDFVTADGSAGRGVYGTLAQALTPSQKVQVSFDKGATWSDAVTTGRNWIAVDTGAHDANWTIQARIVESGIVQGSLASQEVTYLGTQGNAPTITGIADGVGIYTSAKAADGAEVTVSLAGTLAQAGDTLHIIWGDTTYDHVLTAADISGGNLTVTVPAEQTTLQGAVLDFAVTAQIVTADGQISPPSAAFQMRAEGWSTLTGDDLTRAIVFDGRVYQGGGFTVTTNADLRGVGPGETNKGLTIPNAATCYAQFNFTEAVASVSVRFSELENEEGGSRVVVYDTHGSVLFDEKVEADGTGGTSRSALFSFTAPAGAEIGQMRVYGDGTSGKNELVLDSLKFNQIHHAPGYTDTFADDVGKASSYHSEKGHYTLTSHGTVTVVDNDEHNLDGAHLYLGTGLSAMGDSAAIFTFDQPVQSISYTLWGVELGHVSNYSKLEVYDSNGSLIFTRNVFNKGGTLYNYELISYTAPQGLSIGTVKVSQDAWGTLLDNFTSILAPNEPTGQTLIDQNWETFLGGATTASAVEWKAQTFTTPAFGTGATLSGYHSDAGGFTINGSATKTANDNAWGAWVNAMQGSMYVGFGETASVTFDSLRSEVNVSVTGIGIFSPATLNVYGAGGALLGTTQMTNEHESYDIQSFSYQSSGNLIDHIEIIGCGTYVTSISSAVTQLSTAGEIISMQIDPTSYFAQDTAFVHGGAGVDTLNLMGKDQVLDLTALTGDSGGARISSIERFDITGTGDNTLKVSLNDVLHLGGTDLFRKDGKVQLMVDGDAGDTVELHGLRDHGSVAGNWQNSGTTTLNGSTYNIYSYASLDAEVLVKEAVTSHIV